MVVAAVLAVSSVLAAGRGLERAGRETHHRRCRVECCRSRGVHVLVRAHLLPETSPAIAEPHLHSGLGEFGSGDRENKTEPRLSTGKQTMTLYTL